MPNTKGFLGVVGIRKGAEVNEVRLFGVLLGQSGGVIRSAIAHDGLGVEGAERRVADVLNIGVTLDFTPRGDIGALLLVRKPSDMPELVKGVELRAVLVDRHE